MAALQAGPGGRKRGKMATARRAKNQTAAKGGGGREGAGGGLMAQTEAAVLGSEGDGVGGIGEGSHGVTPGRPWRRGLRAASDEPGTPCSTTN
ncbi:MAG: hypothetical protein IPJ98_10930 [Bryobacterales bacterium]|nr:hypothetical protein [Bryobacterales bacterium]